MQVPAQCRLLAFVFVIGLRPQRDVWNDVSVTSNTQATAPTTKASGFGLRADASPNDGQATTFRKYPAAGIAVVVVVVGVAINMIVSQFTNVDYTEIGDSVGNLLKGIGASTGAMVVFLVAAVTWLRWWPPIWRQVPRAAARWIWIVPLAMLVTLVLRYLSTLGTERTITYLVTLVAMAMLVGFGEELAFRGVLVVGLRERFGEGWVWFISSVLFGFAHAGNALSGQDLVTTAFQVFVTFLLGTVLYVARMVTGTLIVPIVLHGLWDVAAIGLVTADAPNSGLAALSNLVQWLMIIAAFVAVWSIARQGRSLSATNELPVVEGSERV